MLVLVVGCGEGNTAREAATASSPAAEAIATSAPAMTAAPAVATVAAMTQATETSMPATTMAATTAEVTPGAAIETPARAGEGEFQNPVLRADFADPGVLKVDDTYYAYATNASGKNIQAARSQDLVKWEVLPDAMPALPKWARLGGSLVWAPEVAKIGEKFVLYYTARDKESNKQCVGVATSDKPEGKFRDTNDKPFVCQAQEGGTIDASPFFDEGKWYLLFKNDGNCCSIPTHLYIQEMTPDGLGLVGEPTRLVRNDRAWEGRVVEAPTMWKHEGKYYLFFSANDYAGPPYAVGYANCESAVGPCEDAPENPILKSVLEKPLVIGPGHQTIIQDDDGETWIVYHAWEVTGSGTRGSRRFMWIDQLVWEDGKPVVKGPTTDPQPVP
ncbi:MAG TPA: glycoside hydrolase family 43 protein [Herpetosiphonaceae bacterium]|nr:glycoside hydrolase family 43 protein [Herpetosiphonaceae bacterium]